MDIDGADHQCFRVGSAALRRIANAFRVPEETFVQAVLTGKDAPGKLASAMQANALLDAFEQITDPAVRERCLDYVRAAAARSADPAA